MRSIKVFQMHRTVVMARIPVRGIASSAAGQTPHDVLISPLQSLATSTLPSPFSLEGLKGRKL